MVNSVLDSIYIHYGNNFKIAYIANRIHSYSTDPHTWTRLQKKGHDFIIAASLVIYNKDIGIKVAAVEKQISTTSLKICNDLNEAINWSLNLREFK